MKPLLKYLAKRPIISSFILAKKIPDKVLKYAEGVAKVTGIPLRETLSSRPVLKYRKEMYAVEKERKLPIGAWAKAFLKKSWLNERRL